MIVDNTETALYQADDEPVSLLFTLGIFRVAIDISVGILNTYVVTRSLLLMQLTCWVLNKA